jgi:hypothetical protein
MQQTPVTVENRRSALSGMWSFLALLFGALIGRGTAVAATRIKPAQVQGGLPNSLMGFDAQSQGMTVVVGAGLSISGGVLTANPVFASVRSYNVVLNRQANGTYPLPTSVQAKPVFHRNGIRQLETEDYSYASGVMTPTATAQYQTDDLVTCDGEPAA